MSAAEARAIWQRTANRCFVQEDTKRAPKFARCQSSSSHKQADSCSINYGPQKGSTNELLNALEHGEENLKSVECNNSMKTNDFCYDPESPWKAEPWWRTTDGDDLASLVARKSMDFIENCDLPPPQKLHARRCSHEHFGSFDNDEVSSSAWKSRIGPIPSTVLNNVQCASNTSFRFHFIMLLRVDAIEFESID
ncbi:hypothetical protein V6N11_041712 [Hibiscus sabdariffa]|uniref:Uncharacterized protein n=1 Tax=Hibiscus sabdariffa TaxID=183260 RepID=A0ABR2RL47_9ROSI